MAPTELIAQPGVVLPDPGAEAHEAAHGARLAELASSPAVPDVSHYRHRGSERAGVAR